MYIISTVALLAVLFYLMGKSADLVIYHVRRLGINLGIKQFWLGLILGILTSLPELAVGIEASIRNIGQLSFGNLMGGVIVLLGLILGLTVVLDNGIDVNISLNPRDLSIMLVYISLPLWLMLDGVLSFWDGVLLIVTYGLCIYYFLKINGASHFTVKVEKEGSNLKSLWLGFLGLIAIVAVAKFIIDIALPLLAAFNLRPFLIGVIVFSLGTNLPEFTLALRSWKDNVRDLSFGNLVGSAFANPLIIGLFAFIKPIHQLIDLTYFVFMAAILILLVVLFILSFTGRRLTSQEGFVLIGLYAAFIATEVILKFIN